MAIMYDHEVEITMTVYVQSMQENDVDCKDDVTDAVASEITYHGSCNPFVYEIVNTTTGDY
jgi:hypothetical protein